MEKGEKKDIKKKKSTQRTLLFKYCFSNADRCEHQSPLKAGMSNKCTRFRRPTRSCSSEKGRDKPAKTVGFLPFATANDHHVSLRPSSISFFFGCFHETTLAYTSSSVTHGTVQEMTPKKGEKKSENENKTKKTILKSLNNNQRKNSSLARHTSRKKKRSEEGKNKQLIADARKPIKKYLQKTPKSRFLSNSVIAVVSTRGCASKQRIKLEKKNFFFSFDSVLGLLRLAFG